MFLSDDFLLKDDWAKKLLPFLRKNMPIIDYHCHLGSKKKFTKTTISAI